MKYKKKASVVSFAKKVKAKKEDTDSTPELNENLYISIEQAENGYTISANSKRFVARNKADLFEALDEILTDEDNDEDDQT